MTINYNQFANLISIFSAHDGNGVGWSTICPVEFKSFNDSINIDLSVPGVINIESNAQTQTSEGIPIIYDTVAQGTPQYYSTACPLTDAERTAFISNFDSSLYPEYILGQQFVFELEVANGQVTLLVDSSGQIDILDVDCSPLCPIIVDTLAVGMGSQASNFLSEDTTTLLNNFDPSFYNNYTVGKQIKIQVEYLDFIITIYINADGQKFLLEKLPKYVALDGGANTTPPALNDPAPTNPYPIYGHDGNGVILWESIYILNVGWVSKVY